MVRADVIRPAIIKRSGIIAASFLIATVALVIVNANTAKALLGVELPLGKTVAPITDRVNGLVNKGLGLPVTIDSTDKLSVEIARAPVADAKLPIVPALVDGVTRPIDGVVEGVSDTVEPVTDNTLPAVRGALMRTLGNGNNTSTPPPLQPTAPPSDTNPDSDIAGVATKASTSAPKNTDNNTLLPQQPTLVGGVTSFFASTMPKVLQDIARNITGKEVGLAPAVISLVLFLVTLGAVGSIVYASNHGGVISFGRHKFKLFKNGNDRTEMATFTVVAICFGFVAMFLALTI